ncbi:3-hydroxyacyl-CoA dehydrogenase NAD-binding domain-containing protein [Streptomyces sp. NPDC102473]
MSTTPQDISKVGVIGCGLMGSGIAEVCTRAGLDTLVGEVAARPLITVRG